jgi:hypothetical protein
LAQLQVTQLLGKLDGHQTVVVNQVFELDRQVNGLTVLNANPLRKLGFGHVFYFIYLVQI